MNVDQCFLVSKICCQTPDLKHFFRRHLGFRCSSSWIRLNYALPWDSQEVTVILTANTEISLNVAGAAALSKLDFVLVVNTDVGLLWAPVCPKQKKFTWHIQYTHYFHLKIGPSVTRCGCCFAAVFVVNWTMGRFVFNQVSPLG